MTAQEWLSIDPVLDENQTGFETDTYLFKVGDGTSKWSKLPYDPNSPGQYTQCRPLLAGDQDGKPFEPPVKDIAAFVVDKKRLVLFQRQKEDNSGPVDPNQVGDQDASFGGIVLKGYRDHFLLYDYANNAWNTSDNLNLSCETGLLIDNRKAIDEQKVRCGNRTKGGKFYLGSGEHNTWRIGVNEAGDLVIEYRRLDGRWVEKQTIASPSAADRGDGRPEADNPYIEQTGQSAKKPTKFDPSMSSGNEFWELFEADDKDGSQIVKVPLCLNTDDAFALGRIMKRTVNFNGTIPGPVIKARVGKQVKNADGTISLVGDVIEIEFLNEIDDLGEIEPWNDGGMQRHEMVHAHIDDRKYGSIADGTGDGGITDDTTPEQDQLNSDAVKWMSHVMMRGSTNLHTHGFHVTPGGFGDNVMRSAKPGSRLRHRYKLPGNHFGGLQWYHPHGHGGSFNIITRGAMGLILIEGPYQKRLNDNNVDREYMVLQRIEWGNNLNGRDELNWIDYVSKFPKDMFDPDPDDGVVEQDGQRFLPSEPKDLSPYYKDNLDPKCVCSCAAIEDAPADHTHGEFSMATPNCDPVEVLWVPAINGQKRPVFKAKVGELKIFSMVNGTGITFFRIAVEGHHIVVACRDGIPQVASAPPLSKDPIDPDFVRHPAGQRLNYVICNSGQRFEFFLKPQHGVTVKDGDTFPIYWLPITEKEEFSTDEWDANLKVNIGTLKYEGTLPATKPNHVCRLKKLLPDVTQDDPLRGEDNDKLHQFPEDRRAWTYISLAEDWPYIQTTLPATTATVIGAMLTIAGATGTIAMPLENPDEKDPEKQKRLLHHLETDAKIRITVGGETFRLVVTGLDEDPSQFQVGIDPVSPGVFPGPGVVNFEYDLFKISKINNNSDTPDDGLEIVELLTDHYYYRNLDLTAALEGALKDKIVRQRNMSFSFAHPKPGLAESGSDSTLMNGSAFNDFRRTVAYKGSNEEIVIQNRSDVIHLFHIHINYFQVMGYRDASFGANKVLNPPPANGNCAYASYETEIHVPFEGFEDTTTIPPGAPAGDDVDAVEGKRGEVRVRISYEDFVGLFLMHCHLLDDQDMGMMQEVEVVAKDYVQAPFSQHRHSAMM